MKFKDLEYRHISFIREVMREKREQLWNESLWKPHRKKIEKMSVEEIEKIKKKFDDLSNPLTEIGLCNNILQSIDDYEKEIQEELKC